MNAPCAGWRELAHALHSERAAEPIEWFSAHTGSDEFTICQAAFTTMRLHVHVPDAENYWRKQIKCQEACPVHTDARGYVRAIAEGRFDDAYLIARGPNPLASICGRVCGAPCEAACRRGVG